MTNNLKQFSISGLLQKDPIQFRRLMEVYYPVICHYANKIVKDQAAAEDVTSEAFLKVWQALPDFDSLDGIKKFLYVIVRNSSINILRSRSRQEKKEAAYLDAIQNLETEDFTNDLIEAESWARIYSAINTLPPKMQQVVKMGYIDGLKNKEIADQLNVSVFTIKAQKQRAKELLSGLLESKDFLLLLLLVH